MDIMETIRSRYSEVSSVQKRIADYCLEHPDKASFQTLREFAQTTHTTDATVLKFCRKIIDGEKRGLDMTFQYLDTESFMQIVYRMNHARRIFVAGHHLTRIVAEFFLYQLKRIGREAHLVDTSDKKQTCDQLVHATKEDVFVLISIPVYAELTIQLAQHLREAEITSISITDSLTSTVAQACEMSLTCNTEHDVLFNSVSSVIAMIEVLTSGLLLSDRERFLTAQERLERLEGKFGIPQKDQQFVRAEIERQTLK